MTKRKKAKSKSKTKKKKAKVDKTIISVLGLMFTITGTVIAFINAFGWREKWMPYVIIGAWVIGLILAFNSQKSTIKWNRTLGMISVGIMAVSFLIFLIYNQVIMSSDDQQKLRVCKFNLMKMSQAIHRYKNDHDNHFPQNLDVVVDQGYIEKNPKVSKCPLNKNLYILKIDGWDSDHFTLICPNSPIKHIGEFGPGQKTSELYYSSLLDKIIHNSEESR